MQKESIAVIGAGIGGITTAIILAKAGYDVTLIEKEKDVSLGSSALPGRLQVGGLYVGEYATKGTANAGKQCVDAAIAFKQMYDGDIWAEDKGACFLIDDEVSRKKEGKLTLDQYEDYFRILRDRYETLCRQDPKNHVLFKDSTFYRRMTNEELSLFTEVNGGIKTLEPGFSVPKVAVGLRRALKQHNVHVITEAETHKILPVQADGRDAIKVVTIEQGKTIERTFSQVVQCAGLGGKNLDMQMGIFQPITVQFMGAGIFTVPEAGRKYPTTYVVYGNHTNFQRRGPDMGDSAAIIMSGEEGVRTIGAKTFGPYDKIEIPEEWRSWLDREVKPAEVMERAKENARYGAKWLPFLKDEGIEFKGFFPGAVLRHDPNSHLREQKHVYATRDDYYAGVCEKYSSAPLLALDVLRHVENRSIAKGLKTETERAIPTHETSVLVPENLRIKMNVELDQAREWAAAFGLPTSLVPGEVASGPIGEDSFFGKPASGRSK